MNASQLAETAQTVGKPYEYIGLPIAVSDDEDIKFSIVFCSPVLTGYTLINLPNTDNDPNITDEGEVILGKGRDLRDLIKVYSNIACFAPQSDDIKVEYYLNNMLLCKHENHKTGHDPQMGDYRKPFITIKFTMQRRA